MRRALNSFGWLSLQLFAAIIDMLCLGFELLFTVESAFAIVATVTACVLSAFLVDLGLRAYTYRLFWLRSRWGIFDLLVVLASAVLYFVELSSNVIDLPPADSGEIISMGALCQTFFALRILCVRYTVTLAGWQLAWRRRPKRERGGGGAAAPRPLPQSQSPMKSSEP